MKSQKILISIPSLIFLIVLLTSCNKAQMPDENKDWNILEWTVDGTKYKASCKSDPLFGCDPVDCEYYPTYKAMTILGSDDNNDYGIYISIRNNIELNKKIELGQHDEMEVGNGKLEINCRVYSIDTTLDYSLKVSNIDSSSKIIKGYFGFTGINECQDTLLVEDGYFKLTYRP